MDLMGTPVYLGQTVSLVTVQGHTRKSDWKITWRARPLREPSSSPVMGDRPTTQSRAPNQNSEVAQRLAWVHPSREIYVSSRDHTLIATAV